MTSSAKLRSSTSVEHDGKVLRPLAFQRSDAALIRDLRNGRPDAVEQLCARYAEEVATLMIGLLGPDARLADAVHDVFERLIREARRRDPGSLSSKLLRLGVRVARHSLRRRSAWSLRHRAARKVARADVSRLQRKLYQCLERLPEDERIAFCLHFIAGHPPQEVAAAMGLSLTAVRRRLAKAQAAMELGRAYPDLGREMAAEQASWLQRSDVVRVARERLLSPPPARRLDTVVVVLFVAVVATILTLWPRTPDAMSFRVGADTPGVERAWWTAETGKQLPLRFDDGGEIRLIDGARARVTHADREHAEMMVERGTVHVEAAGAARWVFVVGPFDLVAKGARFEARWLPAAQRLDLAVGQGEVRVTGPDFEERVVGAGDSLAAHATEGVVDAVP